MVPLCDYDNSLELLRLHAARYAAGEELVPEDEVVAHIDAGSRAVVHGCRDGARPGTMTMRRLIWDEAELIAEYIRVLKRSRRRLGMLWIRERRFELGRAQMMLLEKVQARWTAGDKDSSIQGSRPLSRRRLKWPRRTLTLDRHPQGGGLWGSHD